MRISGTKKTSGGSQKSTPLNTYSILETMDYYPLAAHLFLGFSDSDWAGDIDSRGIYEWLYFGATDNIR